MKSTLPGSFVCQLMIQTLTLMGLMVSLCVYGQEIKIPGSNEGHNIEVPSKILNYTHFTTKTRTVDEQWLKFNPDDANHPDAIFLPPEQPIPGAIEVLAKRTQTSRYFVDKDRPSRVFSQSAYGPLHYESDGKWLLIDHRLSSLGKHSYGAMRQPEPTGFDMKTQRSFIKTRNGEVFFNNWKLYGRSGKEKKMLAKANWKNHTAGDDGVFITEIFPGIDAEMKVHRGQIKTNFIIKKWAFSDFSEILFEDSYTHQNQLSFHFKLLSNG